VLPQQAVRIESAVKIIRRTNLKLLLNKPNYGKQRYNKKRRLQLLSSCRRRFLFGDDMIT